MFHLCQCSCKPGLHAICVESSAQLGTGRLPFNDANIGREYALCTMTTAPGGGGGRGVEFHARGEGGGGRLSTRTISCLAGACVTTHTACHYSDTILSDWPRPPIMQPRLPQGAKPRVKQRVHGDVNHPEVTPRDKQCRQVAGRRKHSHLFSCWFAVPHNQVRRGVLLEILLTQTSFMSLWNSSEIQGENRPEELIYSEQLKVKVKGGPWCKICRLHSELHRLCRYRTDWELDKNWRSHRMQKSESLVWLKYWKQINK